MEERSLVCRHSSLVCRHTGVAVSPHSGSRVVRLFVERMQRAGYTGRYRVRVADD